MKCRNCGMDLASGDRFCGNCGTPVVVEPTPVVVEPTPVVNPTPVERKVETASVPKSLAPMLKLPTDRSLLKMIGFGLLTFGIYPAVIYSNMVEELNLAASRYDGERTTNYYVYMLFSGLTLGIYSFYWMHTFANRIGKELSRRGYEDKFSAKDFWLWSVLGSLIIVGPFVYVHKLVKSMNKINESYNYYG